VVVLNRRRMICFLSLFSEAKDLKISLSSKCSKKTVEMKKVSRVNGREISSRVQKRQSRAPDEISERYSFKHIQVFRLICCAPFFSTKALRRERASARV